MSKKNFVDWCNSCRIDFSIFMKNEIFGKQIVLINYFRSSITLFPHQLQALAWLNWREHQVKRKRVLKRGLDKVTRRIGKGDKKEGVEGRGKQF